MGLVAQPAVRIAANRNEMVGRQPKIMVMDFYHERGVLSKLPGCKENQNDSGIHGGIGAARGASGDAAIRELRVFQARSGVSAVARSGKGARAGAVCRAV